MTINIEKLHALTSMADVQERLSTFDIQNVSPFPSVMF